MNKKRHVSLAVVMVMFGMGLILAAFIVPPTGYIDPTVLTAFGEMLTFAGSLIGIDYHYKYKLGNDIPVGTNIRKNVLTEPRRARRSQTATLN